MGQLARATAKSLRFFFACLVLTSATIATSCGGGSSLPQPNPVPSVTSLSPSFATAGAAAQTLTINGANFLSSSTVTYNGVAHTSSFISSIQLEVSLSASDQATVGTYAVVVTNPSPGGGPSNAINFSVNIPPPTLSGLSPHSANAGGDAFALTVYGSNFVSGSTVQWNGSSRPTSYVTDSQLTATIDSTDINTTGSANITVANPTSVGGTSSPESFTIYPAIPAKFVAPNGSDSNPGTIDQPYLTIQQCATSVASGGTCEVRAGIYRETVTPNSGITITSYNGESVTVDGSDPVTGWTLFQGAIYKASASLSNGDTNQVFVGNQMMTEARWPNGDDLFNVNWATAQAGTSASQIVDSNLPNIDWTGAKIHLWSGSDPWDHETGIVTTSSAGQIAINIDETGTCPYICPMAGGYYYLFGILGALDTEGEWFYDSSGSTLYFWPPGSVSPNTLNVRAKQRPYAFDLSGKSNVTIQNINILACTINTDTSSASNIIDRISAQYVSHFTSLPTAPNDSVGFSIEWDHDGDTGIILNGSGNILQNSTIAFSAGDGVALLGSNITVSNNLIHHVDYMGDFSSGIFLSGNNNIIQMNTIHTIGRDAIFVNSAGHQEINYNNLFNGMMLSRDGAELYVCCYLVANEARMDHNWIHDTQSLISGAADNYPDSGVYIDLNSGGFELAQNVLWNNEFYSIFLNGGDLTSPNNNNVHNNSIPDVGNTSYIWLAGIPNCGTTRIIDNLVLVPVNLASVDPSCTVTNNNASAPGATEMNSSVQVGCNFTGCSSSGPPAISGGLVAASIATQPNNVTVSAGQTATFSVTGAGSTPLSYQWQKNGVNIAAATSPNYTTPATTAADNGAVFTVRVSNSVGGVTSNPASLTVD